MFLKQSTAVTIKLGPFVDETDGKTAETGLTLSQADVRLSKNGGDMAQKGDASSCTHDEIGVYDCPLSTTDTGTLGILDVFVHESGALPVFQRYMVMPANVWDSMFGADYLQVDATQILGTAVSTPATAGILDVNLKNIANAAVSTSSAQLGVNIVNAAGTAWASGAITSGAFATGAITAGAIAADAIGASELAADAATEIGTAVWANATRTLSAATNVTSTGAAVPITAGGLVSADMTAVSADTGAADALETMLDGTGGNVLSLKQLNIVATGNDSALVATGSGTGSGILATGGATGHGYKGLGGATSGHGMYLLSQGSSSSGLYAAGDTNGPGITANGGSGDGPGILTAGSGTGSGLVAAADGSGAGIKAYGGTSGGAGLHLEGQFAEDLRLESSNTVGLKVNSFSDDAITAAAIATDAFGADALAAAFVDEIIDEVIEGTTTLRQAIRLLLSAVVGKASGGGSTTVIFRDLADTKDRITATVDANGNRSAVVRDVS